MLKRIIALILVLLMVLPFAIACNTEPAGSSDSSSSSSSSSSTTQKPTSSSSNDEGNKDEDINSPINPDTNPDTTPDKPFESGELFINGISIADYVVVIPEGPTTFEKNVADSFVDWVFDISGTTLTVVTDATAATDKEIIIGNTTRAESSEAASSLPKDQRAFNGLIKGNKLAVNFGDYQRASVIALTALKRAFINNKGKLSESFSNENYTLEEIAPLAIGGIEKKVIRNDASFVDGVYMWKCTQAQSDAWHVHLPNGNHHAACDSVGLRLDFDTDSPYFYYKQKTGSPRLIMNDKLVEGWSGGYFDVPEENLGKVNRFVILMNGGTNCVEDKTANSYTNTTYNAILEFKVAGGCKTIPHEHDLNILFIGDSITQGYNNHGHPESTYTFYTSMYFNANSVVQGNGGSQCWTDMIDPDMAQLYQPDMIIVAMGTNDYASNQGKDAAWFENRMDTFLDKIEQVYPGVKIIGITPIRRLYSMNSNDPETNYDKNCVEKANKGYAAAFTKHGAYVVPGEALLRDVADYADTIHPNEDGFLIYGEYLCLLIENEVKKIVAAKKAK